MNNAAHCSSSAVIRKVAKKLEGLNASCQLANVKGQLSYKDMVPGALGVIIQPEAAESA
jgi:hypothetical protein